jgi:hypothetical protein
MSATAGIVMLRHKDAQLAMPIEVHVEDEEAWQGYNLANPFAGYRTYAKDNYAVVEDRRV